MNIPLSLEGFFVQGDFGHYPVIFYMVLCQINVFNWIFCCASVCLNLSLYLLIWRCVMCFTTIWINILNVQKIIFV